MAETGQNLEMYQGESRQLVITVRDGNTGDLFDLTGFSVKWVLYHPTTKEVVLTKTSASASEVEIENPASGVIKIYLLQEDTVNMLARAYNHECEIELDPEHNYVVCTGVIKLLYSVT